MRPQKFIQLSRIEFREQVFARDGHKCVFCPAPAKDAHHIIERRLWGDSLGYYIENGASVCDYHHLECEMTHISVEDVRLACGITDIIVPEHLYPDHVYDKWGNVVLPNGMRTKGELFYDKSVHMILELGGVLPLFTDYVKYPRTYHLPWSKGKSSDDKTLTSLTPFLNARVIVTEKMDGENTTWYTDYYHARSIDSAHHPSRDRVKALWAERSYNIPKGWRVCGENVYAKHSIAYDELDSFFYGFSIWTDKNECLSWDDTLEWFELLDIIPVPILYDGIFDENVIKNLYNERTMWNTSEGYILRIANGFDYRNFKNSVAKYVRENHVQNVPHWMYGTPIIPNKLKKNENVIDI